MENYLNEKVGDGSISNREVMEHAMSNKTYNEPSMASVTKAAPTLAECYDSLVQLYEVASSLEQTGRNTVNRFKRYDNEPVGQMKGQDTPIQSYPEAMAEMIEAVNMRLKSTTQTFHEIENLIG